MTDVIYRGDKNQSGANMNLESGAKNCAVVITQLWVIINMVLIQLR
jgi:hypothetical protein